MALILIILGYAGLVDQGLKEILGVQMPANPWLHSILLFGLPLLAVTAQLAAEWHANNSRGLRRRLAIQTGFEQIGYFRIGPYLDIPQDRDKFHRADGAHERALAWIERSVGSTLLYLTGDSGSGKSSLLNAFVLPALRDRNWKVVEARAWQDPETALCEALSGLGGDKRLRPALQGQELRQWLASAASPTGGHLLIVFDQFEEFFILGKPEQQKKICSIRYRVDYQAG